MRNFYVVEEKGRRYAPGPSRSPDRKRPMAHSVRTIAAVEFVRRGLTTWHWLAAFSIALFHTSPAAAATTYNIGSTTMAVTNGDGVCTLAEALLSVQTNATVNECVASGGPYTINLAPGTYMFDTARYVDGNFGKAAFASLAADVTLIGTGPGVTLMRSAGGDNMRFLYGGPFHSTTLVNLTITGFNSSNSAEIAARFGGAIGLVQHTLNLDRVTLTGNSSGFGPGEGDANAIMAFVSQLNIHGSTIADNTAFNTLNSSQIRANQNSTLNMANSTVAGVHIAVNTTLNSTSSLSNVTLSGQLALFDDGAGSTTSIRNAILMSGCQVGGAFTSTNNAGPGSCSSAFPAPSMSSLSDNGGPTRTFIPRLPSNVKDAAPGCAYLSVGANPLFANGAAITVDQRGFARDANCDLGAVETMTLSPASLPGATFGTPYSATLSQTGGAAPVTYSVTSGALPAGLSLNPGTGEIAGTPSAAGNSSPLITVTDSAGFKTNILYSFSVARANQTLTFNTQIPTTRPFAASGTFAINPLATASSGLAPTYVSLTTGVCQLSGTTVTMLSAGTCTIRASQNGNSNYNAAATVNQSIAISQGPQTLTFGAQPAQTFTAGGTFTVSVPATSTSGLAPIYSSLSPAVCTVAGSTVTLVSAGTCTLAADQPGNANYLAAPQVTTTVTINPGVQLISFAAPAPKVLGELPFSVSATGGASSSPVIFTSLTPTVCTAGGINGSLISLLLSGTCTLRASQAGDANYAAAPSVDRSFMVGSGSSSVTLESSLNPSPYRSPVTFTARISGVVPSGVVRFVNGSVSMCEVPVSNAAATCTVSDLMEDAHNIRAYYLGDANNLGAFSAELIQIVSRVGRRQGAWWGGPAENGWGLSIIEHGSTLVAGWYFYDASGQPTWLTLNGCQFDVSGNRCTGVLSRSEATWFGAYQADRFRSQPVGSASLAFDDQGGLFTYVVDGVAGSKRIQRMELGGNPYAPFDYTDVWWGGVAENGWGVSAHVAGQSLTGIWYTYNTAGQPTWFLFNNGLQLNPRAFRSTLYRTRGSPMNQAYNPALFSATAAGELYFDFDDVRRGTMTYQVDGVLQFKPFLRLPF